MTTIRAGNRVSRKGNIQQAKSTDQPSGKTEAAAPAPRTFELDIEELTEGMSKEELGLFALGLDRTARIVRKRAGIAAPEAPPPVTRDQFKNYLDLEDAFIELRCRTIAALRPLLFQDEASYVEGSPEADALSSGQSWFAQDAVDALFVFGKIMSALKPLR